MSDIKRKSIDAIIWNLFEKYGIQIVNLILGVILARLLTPADYGLIGMITVFFALAMVFVNSGFGAAYIQKKDATETDASTIFYFNIFVSTFFYGFLWFAAPLIADFYEQEQLIDLIRVASIILIINSFGMMQIIKLTKDVDFKKKSLLSIISSVISGCLGIGAAFQDFGVWSLVIQQISKSLVNVLGLWIFYKWRPYFIFSISSLRSMFSFASWILLSGLITTFFSNIYILAIGKLFPISELGLYTKSKSYRDMVSIQPTSAIGAVSFPVLSKSQFDKEKSKNMMKKFVSHTLLLVSLVSVVLMVVSKPLVFIVLTNKWLPMVPYLQLLLIAGFFYPLNLFNAQLLNAQGKSRINFKLSLVKNSLMLLNLIIMYPYGIKAIIYGIIALSVLNIFINGFYSKKLIDYGTIEQIKDMSKTLLISFFMIISGLFIMNKISNDYWRIVLGSLYAGGGYTILHYLWHYELFNSTVNEVLSKFKGGK